MLGFLVFLPATLQLTGVVGAMAAAVTEVCGVTVILTAGANARQDVCGLHRVIASGGCLVVLAFATVLFTG